MLLTHNRPLISASELKLLLQQPFSPLVIDCSFDLADIHQGKRFYLQQHIPGAYYLDLDDDLCGTKTAHSGRHPLPSKEKLSERLRSIGLNNKNHKKTPVVVYDQGSGMMAAHAWWLLLWLGHDDVRVLDGGIQAWEKAGGDFESQENSHAQQQGNFEPQNALVKTVDADFIMQHLNSDALLLIDARAPERYRGDVEPLDPVAGHIPGAINRHFALNLNPDNTFKAPELLLSEWQALLDGHPQRQHIVHSCGSGVSACHNILAMTHAGLGLTALYAGSWSQWCSYPSNPVSYQNK